VLGLQQRPAQILLLGTTALGLTATDDDRYWNAELVEAMVRDGSWTIMEDLVADLTGARRVLDVGGDGVNSSALAAANPHVEFTVLNLPEVADIARCKIAERGLSERISVHDGDIFADRYPAGHDCVLFANQLVIWSPEENLRLLEKAFAAAPRRWTAADIQRDLR
jgi:hypothetical protein